MLLHNEISIDYLGDRSTESNLSDSTISLSDRFAITSLIYHLENNSSNQLIT